MIFRVRFQLKEFSSFVGNSRLCRGILELNLPKCLTNKKRKWSLALTILISGACVIVGVTMMSYFLFYWNKKREKDNSSNSSLRQSLLKVSYQMLLKSLLWRCIVSLFLRKLRASPRIVE